MKIRSLLITILSISLVLGCMPINSSALQSKYSHSKSYMSGPYYSKLLNVRLDGDGASNIVNIAKSQLGYHEGSSASDLGGVSTGKKDYCEYNYNIHKGANLAWCSTFLAWCATQAGESKAIPASGSSDDIYSYVIATGGKKIASSEVKAGDLVFYKVVSTGRLCHCGIMTSATTSVEGNYSDAVKECKPASYIGTSGMTVANGKISVLYLRPNYTAKSVQPVPTPPPSKVTINCNKSIYKLSEKVNISFSADNATYYAVSVTDTSNSKVVYKYGSKTPGNISFTPEDYGEYKANVKATNSSGSTEKSFLFSVRLYSDVSAKSFYYGSVKWASDTGVTNGTNKFTFSPNDSCTRAQAITMLWRAAGSPQPANNTTIFSDVEPNKYYFEAVQWAVEQGITDGVNAIEFAPNAVCTRAHIVTFIYRMCSSPSISFKQTFKDVSSKAYYSSAVTWAVKKGITNGTSNDTFSPNDPCTRAQMVTFLHRYYSK